MATTHKKVIVRKMDRDTVSGYVSATFISDGKIEVLNGKYGPYISHNKLNANVPKGKDPATGK